MSKQTPALLRNDKREDFTDLIESVPEFMDLGGQTTYRFNARQACLYTGLQCEELAEKIEAIMEGTITPAQRDHLGVLSNTLRMFSKEFKQGLHEGDILRANHADLIDADFDLAWVSVAAVYSTSIAGHLAIAHGTHTNLAKFPVINGERVCIKDENGKIKKPEGWQPPDFTPYVDPTPRG